MGLIEEAAKHLQSAKPCENIFFICARYDHCVAAQQGVMDIIGADGVPEGLQFIKHLRYIRMPNGATIKFTVPRPYTLRGVSADMIFVSESGLYDERDREELDMFLHLARNRQGETSDRLAGGEL